MSLTLKNDEFKLLRDYIEDSCGISVGDEKEYLIESRLANLVTKNGCDNFKDFLFKAKNEPSLGLRDKIVDAMTTNETLWFRDSHPFKIFKEQLLPMYKEEIAAGKRRDIKIWSAACSTGQEPYSMVMMASEYAKIQTTLKLNHISITATDISPSALFIANVGNYDAIAMKRGMVDDIKGKYFVDKGRFWQVKPELKQPIKYKKFNLQESFFSLGKFDLVLCRNVAIYFSDEFKKNLYKKIAATLNPGGILIVGASESISSYTTEFEMQNYNKGIYYKLRGKV